MDNPMIIRRLLRLAHEIISDMTWEQCIADAKKNPDVRDPEALCGWLKSHGPNASERRIRP